MAAAISTLASMKTLSLSGRFEPILLLDEAAAFPG
jgi:hypothetical protein